MELIRCQNLSIGYHGIPVQQDLHFSICEGDYVCILGENGSGKSTLLKTLLGLQPQISGEIFFQNDLKPCDIGYLPQQGPLQRDFPASVKEIVLSGFLSRHGLSPFYHRAEKQQAEQIMEQMGILDLKNHCYRELSGGQQQRVLLSRALCAAKKLLVLDEPVAGLDPTATEELYQLLQRLNKEERLTILMISHDLPSTLRYAGQLLYLGEKRFFGSISDYQKQKGGFTYAD